MIANLTVGKFLPNFGSYLQGKCQESRPAADKLTNGLFNGGCRKTSVEEKLHNFLTQSHTRSPTFRNGRHLFRVPSPTIVPVRP